MTDWIEPLIADVDWASMYHCRAEDASDIPGMLVQAFDRLASPEREEVRARLTDALCYQGSIFEPTAKVAPVFVAALESDHVQTATYALGWLGILANAYTMSEGQGALHWTPEGHPDRAKVEAQFELEKTWVRECLEAAWAAASAALELLDRFPDSTALRALGPYRLFHIICAGRQLSRPPEEQRELAAQVVSRCTARLARPAHPVMEAGDIAAIATLAELAETGTDVLLRRCEDSLEREPDLPSADVPVDEPAATFAAFGLLKSEGTRGVAARVLARSLRRVSLHDTWFDHPDGFYWLDGHLRFRLVRSLCGLDDDLFNEYSECICDTLREHTNDVSYSYMASPAVARVLGEFEVTRDTRIHDLPPRAIPILEAVRDCAMWENIRFHNPASDMRKHGLEFEHAFWKRMLSDDPVVDDDDSGNDETEPEARTAPATQADNAEPEVSRLDALLSRFRKLFG